ncbi:PIG-L family deacetylase [Deinococcus psychrotolerans]|uniref:PIG-L family deacetylase n=1 Tax=Deinococcus psychrotolerans TaxID=2489213 RepID=A0A3G8YBN3_9DEIO|nr:PIG-L family deacetylase [Deinococcus psychrotolerans]AZI42782.1 PIG-L family deacetylase [Deinococcus psychrotolerans]
MRLYRPRKWKRLAAAAVILLLLAAFINGWYWLPTGRLTVHQVKAAAAALPIMEPLSGRVLFVSPHPDDETLAAGGLLQDVIERGGQVYVVFLTSGDGFEWDARATNREVNVDRADMLRLGLRRMNEARAATAALGIPKDHIFFLGFPDQGLTPIYLQNYLSPYTSPHTGVNRVPYAGTFAPGKPYTGKELDRQLAAVYDQVKPDTVLAPSAQDGHPDHRTAAYVSSRLATQRGEKLYFYLVHGGLEWPLPKGKHEELPLAPPRPTWQGLKWNRYPVTDHQRKRQIEAIKAYKTQLMVVPRFMWAFVRQNELLLPAPAEGAPIPPADLGK